MNTDVDKNKDLNLWLARVKLAKTRKDVFRILDEFRKFEWNDVQCQTMSHLYMRIIDFFPPEEDSSELEVATASIAADTASGAAAAAGVAAAVGADATEVEGEAKKAVINEGPVWYEKM